MKVFAILTVAVATALMLLTIPSAATPRARIQPFGPTVGHAQFLVNPLHVSERAHPVNYNGSAPDAKTIGIEYAEKYLLHGSEYRIQSSYTSPHNSVTHLYLRQLVDGLEVLNGDININVDVDGIVISHGNSFYSGGHALTKRSSVVKRWGQSLSKRELSMKQGLPVVAYRPRRSLLRKRDDPVSDPVIGSSDSISPQNALLSFAQYLNIEILHPENMTLISTPSLDPSQPDHSLTNCPLASDGNVPFGIAYLQTDDGSSLEPVYDFKIDMKGMDNWFHAQIHAESGKVLRVLDWVSDAVYNVYPVGTNDPSDGDRQLVVNPEDIATASPQGWVRAPTQGNNSGYVSSGNNVFAGDNRRNGNDWTNNPTAHATVDDQGTIRFDFAIDLTQPPASYMDAAITNLFYWNNKIHDLFYHYGFDETSGNFQDDNWNRGGAGGDAVIANAQDGSGTNNANFATPPDGQRGRMRMYIWDLTSVARDGDLDNGIIIHEYAHGISNRLTGGPANVGCLPWGEAGGMGEGWGDFFATMLRQRPEHNYDSVFKMGDYVNDGAGIRRFPYSTSMTINTETYQSLDGSAYWGVHAKGAVWANILYEVYRNLETVLPFSSEWQVDDKTKFANTLVLQIVVDGMKLQPCMPTFITARDAIIQAESLLTRGQYECLIWKAFAKRGLGAKAKATSPNSPYRSSTRTQSFDLPSKCTQGK